MKNFLKNVRRNYTAIMTKIGNWIQDTRFGQYVLSKKDTNTSALVQLLVTVPCMVVAVVVIAPLAGLVGFAYAVCGKSFKKEEANG